jgi:glycosyltransferase involved in cell wall biosynthesis
MTAGRQGREDQLVTEHPARVVYIAGAGRSGSTLVERTLGAIPGWVNIGEMIELVRKPSVAAELCGCGHPFESCEFWSEVGRIAFGSWSPDELRHIGRLQQLVSRQRYVPRLFLAGHEGTSRFARALREYGDFYRALYDAVAKVADAEVIVDASKGPGQALALQRIGLPVSLLHLVRDPRGVAYSWSKTQVSRPHGGEGAVMGVHGVRHSAYLWAAFQAEIALIRPVFDHAARMRYEDFVVDPRGRVEAVLDELSLGRFAARIDHVHGSSIDLSQSHGIAGNPSRFQHGTVKLRLDEEWHSKLSRADYRQVTAIAAPWLVRYGYPLRVDHAPQPAAGSGASGHPDPVDWPAVSVVLPTRNRPELLTEAARSVVDQDYAGQIELIVVHDQEEPLSALKELARAGRSVMLIENTCTPGLAGARNAGLEQATSQFIASCDDDDFWDDDKLRLQMTRMLAEDNLVVLGAGIRLLMAEDRVVDWPGDSPVVTRADLLAKRRKELHSSTLLIRRRVFDAVGGYDEALPSSYAEDYEFLLRAVTVGDIGVINTPLASIRKYNASWFRERAEVVAEALTYLLQRHPEIMESRRGHARVLGQIAFARSMMGDRGEAARLAARAFMRWPVAPHAALALVHGVTGIDPRVLLASVRRAGRGIT